LANSQYSLAAIIGESADSTLGAASYYGVALTTADQCKKVDGTNSTGNITGLDATLSVCCVFGRIAWWLWGGPCARFLGHVSGIIVFVLCCLECSTQHLVIP